MEKYIFDKNNGLWYELHGDYYFPILEIRSEDEAATYGKYGMLRKAYLKEKKPARYQLMLLQGILTAHLKQVDEEARERVEFLVTQMAAEQGVTEKMKEEDAMKWCGVMNNFKHCAEEIVLKEIIYV